MSNDLSKTSEPKRGLSLSRRKQTKTTHMIMRRTNCIPEPISSKCFVLTLRDPYLCRFSTDSTSSTHLARLFLLFHRQNMVPGTFLVSPPSWFHESWTGAFVWRKQAAGHWLTREWRHWTSAASKPDTRHQVLCRKWNPVSSRLSGITAHLRVIGVFVSYRHKMSNLSQKAIFKIASSDEKSFKQCLYHIITRWATYHRRQC